MNRKKLFWKLPILLATMFAVQGCDTSTKTSYQDEYAAEDGKTADEAPRLTRDDALTEAAALQSGSTYGDLGEPYGCTDNCSGHEAGVAWAEDNGLHDPGDCGGRSHSFYEGCLAYTEAILEAAAQIEQDAY